MIHPIHTVHKICLGRSTVRNIINFPRRSTTQLFHRLNTVLLYRLFRPFMAYFNLPGMVERLRNKEPVRMRKQFPLFVGYFKSGINRKTVVGFLRENCPGIRFIDLYRCTSRESGKAYCCKLTFDSKRSLERATKTLSKRSIKGRNFVVRDWIERTAANERRNVNWRTNPDFNGECKRRQDRRRYQKPITLYVGS